MNTMFTNKIRSIRHEVNIFNFLRQPTIKHAGITRVDR